MDANLVSLIVSMLIVFIPMIIMSIALIFNGTLRRDLKDNYKLETVIAIIVLSSLVLSFIFIIVIGTYIGHN